MSETVRWEPVAGVPGTVRAAAVGPKGTAVVDAYVEAVYGREFTAMLRPQQWFQSTYILRAADVDPDDDVAYGRFLDHAEAIICSQCGEKLTFNRELLTQLRAERRQPCEQG
jgi:hypothetical protein